MSAFKENPAGSQDATIVARDLSWNFWYPRCVSQIVLHAFLGPHVKTHHALRWAYLAALVGFVALDSVAAVALQGVRTCVANRRCRNPDGYDSAGVDLLVARELLALVWAELKSSTRIQCERTRQFRRKIFGLASRTR